MTETAKRHRWPKHERAGECEYEDRCLDCGLLKRAPGPRPPCQPAQQEHQANRMFYPQALYAIVPDFAAYNEVTFVICGRLDDAMRHGTFIAADDLLTGYGSPTASVYRIGDATLVGEARAVDAPGDWEWAREVHAKVAELDQFNASLRDD